MGIRDVYKQEAEKTKGGGGPFWQPGGGTSRIRILPTGGVYNEELGRTLWFIHGASHNNVGSAGNGSVNCPKVIEGRSCFLCQWVSQLYDSPNPTDNNLAKRYKAWKFYISNILSYF